MRTLNSLEIETVSGGAGTFGVMVNGQWYEYENVERVTNNSLIFANGTRENLLDLWPNTSLVGVSFSNVGGGGIYFNNTLLAPGDSAYWS